MPVTVRFSIRSLVWGALDAADAATGANPGLWPFTMVVKLLPEIHNHVCSAQMTQTPTWLSHTQLSHSWRVGAATPARLPFAPTLKRGCNRKFKAPGTLGNRQAGPVPCLIS
jgi:hypothetical protein